MFVCPKRKSPTCQRQLLVDMFAKRAPTGRPETTRACTHFAVHHSQEILFAKNLLPQTKDIKKHNLQINFPETLFS